MNIFPKGFIPNSSIPSFTIAAIWSGSYLSHRRNNTLFGFSIFIVGFVVLENLES